MTKTKVISYLKSVIKCLETRYLDGDLPFIGTELNMLKDVLEYIQDTPAPKKKGA